LEDGFEEDEELTPERAEILKNIENIVQIDAKSAISVCGGPDTYVKIAEEFKDGANAKKELLEEYFNKGDYKNFEVKIHALKSEARLVGAPDFSQMCLRLEKAADDNDIDYVKSRFPVVMEWFDELLLQIEEAFPKIEEADDKELIDDESLKEAYSAMLEMAGVFDMESVEWVMNKLSSYKMPDEEKLRYDKLKQAVLDVDADAVIGILKM
ncbi:MAG: Hpt domain-containing protein, partial [Eubacterium sp.]|nr:Hpt domain-containing protein [Eubacterium sp.]